MVAQHGGWYRDALCGFQLFGKVSGVNSR
jgi:hypothetical protein